MLFQSQVETLVRLGYPAIAGMTEPAFRKRLAALERHAPRDPRAPVDAVSGRLPFVIVIKSNLVPAELAMARVVRGGRSGHMALHPVAPKDFSTIPSVHLPEGDAYLLTDVDRGAETLNVRPEDALKWIRKRRRSPLTLDEGIALVTQYPDFLQKNNGFSLLASRRADQRVPAIWLDGQKRPKLGWCWDRNPHTWLGSASCKRRLGP